MLNIDNRQISLDLLKTKLSKESIYFNDGVSLLNEVLTRLNSHIVAGEDNINQRFTKISGIAINKGRNLLLGCHSLILDSFGQEAGALLRPLIEVVELLEYILSNPERVNEILENNLPSAGEIAKKINGNFKQLRDNLNIQASHFRFGVDAIMHLVDLGTLKLIVDQKPNEEVLKTNLTSLSAFANFLVMNSSNCLLIAGLEAKDLIERVDKWNKEFRTVFNTNSAKNI